MANGKKDNKPERENESAEFTLESILAEYKGTAYISGDKKTPKDILNNRAKKIVEEAEDDIVSNFVDNELSNTEDDTDGNTGDDAAKSDWEYSDPYENSERSDPVGDIIRAYTDVETSDKDPIKPDQSVNSVKTDQPSDTIIFNKDDDKSDNNGKAGHTDEFFHSDSIDDKSDTIVHNASKTSTDNNNFKDDLYDRPGSGFNFFKRFRTNDDESGSERGGKSDIEGTFEDYKEEIFNEPDLKDALRSFALASNSISQRCFPAAIVTIIMALMTFAYENGLKLPFGIGRSQMLASYTLMLLLLLVMILCTDIIVRGVTSLISGVPNSETLIFFSCAFSLVSGAFSPLIGELGVLPYCAVSALSLTCSAFGERRHLKALTDTLKTAVISSEPYGVIAEYNSDIDKSVLKKIHDRTDGFYNNLIDPDVSELAYRYATPILLITAVFLSAITALIRGHGSYFFHILSATLAGAAPLTVMLSFSIPFGSVVNSARKTGAAIAGWGGADEVCFTDGACVTDDDLFPPGTISFSGDARLYNGVSPATALRCTGSIIIASGSGLAGVFSEVLRLQSIAPVKADEFAAFEGGVSAMIQGERVMTGSAAFMNLLGIRIPDDSNMKNAVYTAIDGRLAAMFAIDYKPVNSVQGALIAILKWRVKLFFAMRDFNVTPLMLEQKFKVSLDDIEYIQARDSYNISDPNSNKEGRIAALLTREGLGPFTEVLTGCKLLKSTAVVGTVISVFSAVLGVFLMFIMCWSGSFLAARPGNLITYMLSMLLAVLVVCGYVKFRK